MIGLDLEKDRDAFCEVVVDLAPGAKLFADAVEELASILILANLADDKIGTTFRAKTVGQDVSAGESGSRRSSLSASSMSTVLP